MSKPKPVQRIRHLVGEAKRRLDQTSGRGRKLRGVLELLRPYRRRVILMFVAVVLATGAALAPAPLAKVAIDGGIIPGDIDTLNLVVVAFVASALLLWGASYLQTYLVGWVGQRVLQDLRVRIFHHLQTQSLGFFERRRAGVLISRMTNDVQALDALVTDGVVTLFQSSLMLIGTLAILVWLDPALTLIALCIFPLILVGSVFFRIISANAFTRTREKIALITAYLQETISGIRLVRSSGQESRHIKRFRELNEDNREANMQTVYLNASYFPLIELLAGAMTVAILLFGGYRAIDGDLTIGVLVAFIAALTNFFEPLQQLSQLYTTYQQGMAALDKIFELLDTVPDAVERTGNRVLQQVSGAVTFEQVDFAYGTDPVLKQIDLEIVAGQTVALVGQTGAGKSTIAKLVARFYDPTAGRITLDGTDLREISVGSLRSHLGIVPQEGFLFSGTVNENIAFGCRDPQPDTVKRAADAVGAAAMIESLPDGYETEIGERGVKLSAGQRQLIAFARALAADPRLLILDEATSHVDLHTEQAIETALETLIAGRTSIVIAHRLSTIQRADKIVVLEHGRVQEAGTHSELLQAQGAYWRLWSDWAQVAERDAA